MKTYEDMLKDYRKRQHDTVVDTLAAGLSYMDEIAVDAGLLEETGILAELADTVSVALPFVMIAATEGTKIILGRKPMKNGMQDGAYRMVKTGAALAVGGTIASAAGFWAAIPAAMGVRLLFDQYRSKALTGMRVQNRTKRLHELNAQLRTPTSAEPEAEPIIPLDEPILLG